jgi:hypothetical protein
MLGLCSVCFLGLDCFAVAAQLWHTGFLFTSVHAAMLGFVGCGCECMLKVQGAHAIKFGASFVVVFNGT